MKKNSPSLIHPLTAKAGVGQILVGVGDVLGQGAGQNVVITVNSQQVADKVVKFTICMITFFEHSLPDIFLDLKSESYK